MKNTILVIDDDKKMRELLSELLTKNNYRVYSAENANDAYEEIKTEKPDLILLDLMLPDIHGIKFCEFLRKEAVSRDIPVIMLTCDSKIPSRITGLEIGADDYITKPFINEELLARIKAVLRRRNTPQSAYDDGNILKSGSLVVDIEGHTVKTGSTVVKLKPREFELLCMLMKERNKVLTRDVIFEELWGEEYTGTTRTVDVHIRYLRRKLKNHSSKIITVESMGYKFSDNPESG